MIDICSWSLAPVDMRDERQANEFRLSEAQKRAIREDYDAAMRGEVVDARAALEEIRVVHGFPLHEDSEEPLQPEREDSGELSEEMKRAILEGYSEALRGDYVDASAALEEIRVAHGF